MSRDKGPTLHDGDLSRGGWTKTEGNQEFEKRWRRIRDGFNFAVHVDDQL